MNTHGSSYSVYKLMYSEYSQKTTAIIPEGAYRHGSSCERRLQTIASTRTKVPGSVPRPPLKLTAGVAGQVRLA